MWLGRERRPDSPDSADHEHDAGHDEWPPAGERVRLGQCLFDLFHCANLLRRSPHTRAGTELIAHQPTSRTSGRQRLASGMNRAMINQSERPDDRPVPRVSGVNCSYRKGLIWSSLIHCRLRTANPVRCGLTDTVIRTCVVSPFSCAEYHMVFPSFFYECMIHLVLENKL